MRDFANCRHALTVIHSPCISLGPLASVGLLEWHAGWLCELSRSVRVSVFSCDSTDYSQQLGVKCHPVPWLRKCPYLRQFLYYAWLVLNARKMEGTLLLIGSAVPVIPLVKWLSGRPLVVEYRWDYYRAAARAFRWHPRGLLCLPMEALSTLPAALVLAPTEQLAKTVRERYRKPCVALPSARIVVPEPRPGVAKDDSLIVFAGRLHWTKGVDVLLKALTAVLASHPNARLVVCGDGAELAKLRDLAQRSPTAANVRFTGRLNNSEVQAIIGTAAIYVQPTLTAEGVSKAVVEAMLQRAACVVSDALGNVDLVEDRVNGLVVPAGDSARLAAAILELLDHPELRTRLAETAFNTVSKYDVKNCTAQQLAALSAFWDGPLPPPAAPSARPAQTGSPASTGNHGVK